MSLKLILLGSVSLAVYYMLFVTLFRIIAMLPSKKIKGISFNLGFIDLTLPPTEDIIDINDLLYDESNVDKNILREVILEYYDDQDLYLINYKRNTDKYIKAAKEKFDKNNNLDTKETTINFISYYVETKGRERYIDQVIGRFKVLYIVLSFFMINFFISFGVRLLLRSNEIISFIDLDIKDRGAIYSSFLKIVDFISSKYYLGIFLSLSLSMIFVMIAYIIMYEYLNKGEKEKIQKEATEAKLSKKILKIKIKKQFDTQKE